jgi:hypothetical protein
MHSKSSRAWECCPLLLCLQDSHLAKDQWPSSKRFLACSHLFKVVSDFLEFRTSQCFLLSDCKHLLLQSSGLPWAKRGFLVYITTTTATTNTTTTTIINTTTTTIVLLLLLLLIIIIIITATTIIIIIIIIIIILQTVRKPGLNGLFNLSLPNFVHRCRSTFVNEILLYYEYFAGYVAVCVLFYCRGKRRQHNLQNPLNNTVQQDAKM